MRNFKTTSFAVTVLLVAALSVTLASVQAQAGIVVTQFPVVTGENASGVALSGNNIVWTEIVGSTGFAYNQNIYGYNISTQQAFPINTDEKVIWQPAMDLNTVVWGAWDRNGTSAASIYGYNTATQSAFTIVNTGNPSRSAISGSTVVYTDIVGSSGIGSYNQNIYGYNLWNHQSYPINTQGKVLSSLFIDGNTVVWEAYDGVNPSGGATIYAYDIADNTTTAICATGKPGALAISGDNVVWTDAVGSTGLSTLSVIRGYNLGTSQHYNITTQGKVLSDLHVDGDFVAWEAFDRGNGNSQASIYSYSYTGQAITTICDTGSPVSLAMTDRRIVWTDIVGHDGFATLRNIYCYDFGWGETFAINTDSKVIWTPIIDGNTVVWGAYDNGYQATIYGATISHLPEPGTIVMIALSATGFAGTIVRRLRKRG
jgi:hypothetical protein